MADGALDQVGSHGWIVTCVATFPRKYHALARADSIPTDRQRTLWNLARAVPGSGTGIELSQFRIIPFDYPTKFGKFGERAFMAPDLPALATLRSGVLGD